MQEVELGKVLLIIEMSIALADFIVVMGKEEVDTPSVDVYAWTELLCSDHTALNVPPWSTLRKTNERK